MRIIHGKGLRSGHRGPVLKTAVSAVLRRTGAVLAYVSARPVDGGTGALYVLLADARACTSALAGVSRPTSSRSTAVAKQPRVRRKPSSTDSAAGSQ